MNVLQRIRSYSGSTVVMELSLYGLVQVGCTLMNHFEWWCLDLKLLELLVVLVKEEAQRTMSSGVAVLVTDVLCGR